MALPKLPPKKARPIAVTIRISKDCADQLKILAREHNMSQADVIEFLISEEYESYQNEKKTLKNKK